MDLSQHWETLVSIILGIALADVLAHAQELIHARERVQWDALPLLWTTIGVLWLFNDWWAVGVGLDGSQHVHVAGGFVLLAVPPVLLFVMSTSVLPRKVPDKGAISTRDEWAKNRSVFLPVFGLNQVAAWVAVTVARGEWIAAIVILSLVIARISTQVVR